MTPTILISNDDSFDAPGIHALARALSRLGRVIVSAPAEPQSAKSHSKTVRGKLKVQASVFEPDIAGYRVWGSPYDAVDIALNALLPEPPELLISGINHGSNVAFDILHSGTVGAASAGYFNHVPAMAVSLNSGETYDYTYAAAYALKAARWFIHQPTNRDYVLNVNIPNCPADAIRGTMVSRMGRRHNYTNTYAHTSDGDFDYYDMAVRPNHRDSREDLSYDDYAVNHRYVVLTPLDMEVTAHASMQTLFGLTESALAPDVES